GRRLPGRWDLPHLQAVHRFVFQNVYDWAGEVRTVAMSKGTDFHPLPQPAYAAGIFARLAADHQLRDLEREPFLRQVSQLESELFALHPFREGNTRSTTTFVSLLARQAGWQIAWRRCDPPAMQDALRRSYRAPEHRAGRELEPLIDPVLSPLRGPGDSGPRDPDALPPPERAFRLTRAHRRHDSRGQSGGFSLSR
ncbi:MAG: Fic family protein, partial [Candidatus Dormiibacterota bacterium]